ncbi:MAG: phage holin family protein [Dethiobacter sp.]|nr:phage holin family protein [Dethiobacter sp.]
MKSIWTATQLTFSVIGAYVGYFLGGWDGFLYALVAFVVADYVTGVMVAVLERKLSSDIGFRGILKKVMIFTLVAVAHTIDSRILGDGSAIRTAVIFFYLSNEGISILENASIIGLPIPQKLQKVLAQLSGKGDA